jgi:hypothetical protein
MQVLGIVITQLTTTILQHNNQTMLIDRGIIVTVIINNGSSTYVNPTTNLQMERSLTMAVQLVL